jgi:hypothetical protein
VLHFAVIFLFSVIVNIMTSSDLDPLFLKALKLLQSRSKESRDQLRQLYDEVVIQRKTELAAKRVRIKACAIPHKYPKLYVILSMRRSLRPGYCLCQLP